MMLSAHAAGHDGHPLALVVAGVALDAPDVVDQLRVGEVGLRDHLGAQGVAGHQHGLAEILRRAADMGREIQCLHGVCSSRYVF